MDIALIQAAYIIAALLFILSLAGLSKHETARDGNVLGMIGMAIALVATLWLALRDAAWGNWVAIIVAVTFTGSIVAFLKLSARISSKPLMLPARHWLNLAALVASAGLLVWFVASHSIVPLLVMLVIALGFGWHLVASIGG